MTQNSSWLLCGLIIADKQRRWQQEQQQSLKVALGIDNHN